MYRIIDGSTVGPPDVAAFLETLVALERNPLPGAGGLFTQGKPLVLARAPGRLDLMGGIADYSGSLVLELPLREAALAAVQRDPARMLHITSLNAEANARTSSFSMPLSDLENGSPGIEKSLRQGETWSGIEPVDYSTAREYFQKDPAQHWAAYAAGAFLVLMRERGVQFPEGARILICSGVPEGKGVSSSAALEVAVMQAVSAAFDISLAPRDLALLCQKVENLVVGAPCGVMDQMTSSCGEAGRLLALLCQPAELQDMIALPEDVMVWGLDSGVRHSVSGADYSSVRTGAFMGYRLIVELAGLRVAPGMAGEPIHVHDPYWGGYLANLSPEEFEQSYADHLPLEMAGAEFLALYSGTTDAVTRVHPGRRYAVRIPTAHPIYENSRVRSFAAVLKSWESAPVADQLEQLGELMFQSHASYSACGLGSAATDRLVELVRIAGRGQGLHGAKITGGGSGGTVAILGRRGADRAVETIAEQYARETGHKPYLFAGSSPGAAAFGALKLS